MAGFPREAWLFTRGGESVRFVREERSTGCYLSVHGPASQTVTYAFANVTECIAGQAAIEQQLLAEGYQYALPVSDRRVEPGTWSGPDHRRAVE